jgi:hypothetical protein
MSQYVFTCRERLGSYERDACGTASRYRVRKVINYEEKGRKNLSRRQKCLLPLIVFVILPAFGYYDLTSIELRDR